MANERLEPEDDDEGGIAFVPIARPMTSDREEAVEELAVTTGMATAEQCHAALIVSRLTRTPLSEVLTQNHVMDEGAARALDEEVNEHLVPGYRILGRIGSGSQGTVYRAIQKCLGREVALKVVSLRSAAEDAASERLRGEARASSKLSHANIVSTYDYGEHGGRVYLAMELVDGISCDRELARRKRPFPIAEVLAIGRGAAEALFAASREGVIHRDIKPSNLLLPNGAGPSAVKVLDLGLSLASVGEPAVDGVVIGTPGYMPPEQARGEVVNRSADIYALGATLYHLATGRRPYEAPEPMSVLLRQVSERLPDPREADPRVPLGFVLLLQGMMARHPESRQGDWGRLLDDMERVANGRAPLFEPPPEEDRSIRSLGLPVSDEQPLLVELDSRIAVYKKDGGHLVRLTELGKPRIPSAGSPGRRSA